MGTIENEFRIKSVALMTGVESEARVCPADKRGIRFHFNGESVEAKIENVVSTEHCTVIGNEKIKIMLIEHFMSACAFCGIDSIDVYLSHYELPILDGAARTWIENFEKATIVNPDKRVLSLKEPVYYLNGKTHLVVLPSSELNITYSVNYKHKDLKNRWVSVNIGNFLLRREINVWQPPSQSLEGGGQGGGEKNDPKLIAELITQITQARTFGYLNELETLQKMGYGKGASLENTLGLKDDDTYTSELKSEFEPIEHKILDLIGDFYLAGCNVLNFKAEIIVKEAGHSVHVKAAKMLKDKLIVEE